MPAPVGPLVGLALGAVLAWLSRSGPGGAASSGWRGSRPENLVALFAALIFAPVCAYFIVFAGDWSLAYLVDRRAIPSAVELVLVVVDGASVLAGFVLGRRLLARRAFRGAAALAAAPFVVALLFVLIFNARLRIDGTFHQVQSDFGTEPVAGGPLGYALLWMNAILAAGFALTVRWLRVHPRVAAPSDAPKPDLTRPSGPGPAPYLRR